MAEILAGGLFEVINCFSGTSGSSDNHDNHASYLILNSRIIPTLKYHNLLPSLITIQPVHRSFSSTESHRLEIGTAGCIPLQILTIPRLTPPSSAQPDQKPSSFFGADLGRNWHTYA